MKYYVSAEAHWVSDFTGEVDVPECVVIKGKDQVRAYIKGEIFYDLRDDMELGELQMHFECDEPNGSTP
jgi:hypothetical protein